MKIYQVVTGTELDEVVAYLGTDESAARCALEQEQNHYRDYLTEREKKNHMIPECRVYDIPDDTDIDDEDELINAMCECTGYDVL